jgi:hypothetical protein
VTRAVTLSSVWCRRCCYAWEWTRLAPHPCTCSRMAWWNSQGGSVKSLLAYRASIHDSMGLTPANLVFGRELHLPCDLLFGAPCDKERPAIDHKADLVDWLHHVHNYGRQHLKPASDRIKTRYNRLASCAGYHERYNVWLCRPPAQKGCHQIPDKWCGVQDPAELDEGRWWYNCTTLCLIR